MAGAGFYGFTDILGHVYASIFYSYFFYYFYYLFSMVRVSLAFYTLSMRLQ
tara:strand:- start:623 stop:775 length:153 start_codon:yes stop_codon:yes gene_type:complete